jgi:hypothetical protein
MQEGKQRYHMVSVGCPRSLQRGGNSEHLTPVLKALELWHITGPRIVVDSLPISAFKAGISVIKKSKLTGTAGSGKRFFVFSEPKYLERTKAFLYFDLNKHLVLAAFFIDRKGFSTNWSHFASLSTSEFTNEGQDFDFQALCGTRGEESSHSSSVFRSSRRLCRGYSHNCGQSARQEPDWELRHIRCPVYRRSGLRRIGVI